MATKPLTTESIALTEKKMDMTLDDIIKMSKKPSTKVDNKRPSNKSQKPFNNAVNNAAGKGNPSKLRRYMDSRASLRQGALNKWRSNFQGNQFPLATETARKAAVAPMRNRSFNRNRMPNWNKPRVGISLVQRRAEVGFVAGKRQQNQQGKVVPKQRPQTLDSLFANMKEQRMRVQQNMVRHSVVGQQRQRGRGRFGNYA